MNDVTEYTVKNIVLASWIWADNNQSTCSEKIAQQKKEFAPLKPLRQWLDNLKVDNPKFARRLCKLIPSQCPFEREVKLFGRPIFHIPPMCKLNPLYEELMMLRFRALCYLADECGEDISAFC
ncbi:Mo-dependent nitrogenase C-terminal domain-containing protein [Oscillatoria salina]|uniref:Mo-dependent nitrogenase C-terminal domain-containing protein n=1 Tax=Oscillatoria salina TaxID=331517 RepID=UPI0013B5CABC|nr:Mo-dependent nitrogenase C-terminal domain-containing protein [Oscillatoria salina]MBZ8178676.1 nitrogenase [Oscillatoria salina IIICB1]NET90477.1 nitrogenase [Kamptonema sp. SIO1D9]